MRSAAIAGVLVSHGGLFFVFPTNPVVQGWLATFGVAGVALFFGLSGFLVGRIVLKLNVQKEGRSRAITGFWVRRWLRTLPNYYLFVLVNLGLSLASLRGPFEFPFLFFGQNLWHGASSFFGESWSLAVEEIFYVVFPLMAYGFLVVWRTPWRNAVGAAAAVFIAVPFVLRVILSMFGDVTGMSSAVPLRLDGIGWGLLIAQVGTMAPTKLRANRRIFAIIGGVCMLIGILAIASTALGPTGLSRPVEGWVPKLLWNVAWTSLAIGPALLLPFFQTLEPASWVVAGTATMSNYAYSLYLVNLPLGFLLTATIRLGASPVGTITTGVVWACLCLAIAGLIHHTYEKPIMDLRMRLRFDR